MQDNTWRLIFDRIDSAMNIFIDAKLFLLLTKKKEVV